MTESARLQPVTLSGHCGDDVNGAVLIDIGSHASAERVPAAVTLRTRMS